MKRSFNLPLLGALIVLTLALGCGQTKSDRSGVERPVATDDVVVQTQEKLRVSMDDLEDLTIDVRDLDAPEGVVDRFFTAFFSGDDDAAFQFLTSKAQNAKRGTFLTKESDRVSWRILGKTKPDEGSVKVLVELEDYDDVGEFQTDLLTFLLTLDDSKWRIARFGIGDIEVDFEEQASSNAPVVRAAGTMINETR